MSSIPLFNLSNGPTLGLNGINQAALLQQNNLALQRQVRDNARDFIDFTSQLDAIGQFADFRAQGLSPSQALFQQSQTSFNPLTAQSGLNNFVNRTELLSPFAIEAARGGNPGLFNSTLGATGIQYDPRNPTSGFGGLGADGIGAQTTFNIRNNALGGSLNNPAGVGGIAANPAVQAIPPSGIGPNQLAYTAPNPVQQPTIPTQAAPTAIQTNQQQINDAILGQARSIRSTDSIFANALANRGGVSNPQSQPLAPVQQPTASSLSSFSDSAAERRRRGRQAVGFSSIYDGI